MIIATSPLASRGFAPRGLFQPIIRILDLKERFKKKIWGGGKSTPLFYFSIYQLYYLLESTSIYCPLSYPYRSIYLYLSILLFMYLSFVLLLGIYINLPFQLTTDYSVRVNTAILSQKQGEKKRLTAAVGHKTTGSESQYLS